MKKFFARPATFCFLAYAGVCAAAFAFVFWGAWGLDRAPVAPDCPTVYPLDDVLRVLRDCLAGRQSVLPGDLPVFLVPDPYFWTELRFAVPCFFAGLGLAYYLRGRGVGSLARYAAAGFYALTGYGVTLFSAGHLGWFTMWPYAAFAFGLVDRAVGKTKPLACALLGAVLGWGAANQPDVWLLFTLLAFCYGVWALVRETRRGRAAPGRWCKGAVLALVCAALVGLPHFLGAVVDARAGREKQIGATSSPAAKQAPEKSHSERWDFCTSWSLPPDETLEFVVPDLNGGSSDPRVSPQNPYKGRIGQRVTIPEGRQARDPRTGKIVGAGAVLYAPYRQHTLYLGGVTVLFALWGAFGWFRRRKDAAAAKRANDVPFWICAALACWVLALGGFTPVYRLVFSLPVGDSIRCPVKFVHLVSFCVCALAGFGVEAALKTLPRRLWAFVALVAVAGVADLARVDHRYLAVENHALQRAPNAVAAELVKRGGNVHVALLREEGADLVSGSFFVHGVDTAETDKARFVLVSSRGLAQDAALKKRFDAGALKLVGSYGLSAVRGLFAAPSGQAPLALLEATDVTPPPEKETPPPDPRRFFKWMSSLVTLALLGVACRLRVWRKKSVPCAS